MKRVNHLFEKIYSFENLLLAFYKARKGKRNAPNVAAFEVVFEYELLKLSEELRTGTYQPGKYRTFKIYEPKERMISAAPFRDRVVHHALCNIIEPVFEKSFIHDTYANRKGKGTHAGIRRCQQYARQYKYVLQGDIKKYFPSINHELLKHFIAKKIKCKQTMALITLIIDNSNPQEKHLDYFPGDNLFTVIDKRKGLPMGNLTSQFFANIYLSSFDHFVKEELGVKGYVRYVDDFVIFGNKKEHLHSIRKKVEHFLMKNHRLLLNQSKTHIFPSASGINFLGQRIFHSHRLIKKENIRRFRKRLRKRVLLFQKGKIETNTFESQLNSWIGHCSQADSWKIIRKEINKLIFVYNLDLFKRINGGWLVGVSFV